MSEPLRQVSIVFLRRNGEILLAMKKRGFGVDKWNGVGGKPEESEVIEETARRECEEEIGVKPSRLFLVAILNFYSPPDKADFNQQASVFFCDQWDGEPVETEEMRPQWFKVDGIPYLDMWADDVLWLPRVLNGEKLEADFHFDDDDKVSEYEIRPLPDK